MWWLEDIVATIRDGRLRSLNESSHHQKNGCCQRRCRLTTCCDADVVARGYSGYNTRWALKVIERVFPPSEERVLPEKVPPHHLL
ncbi:hypothetical protein E6C27_scaffold90G001590 [Cucumis melo var. makuwa]|uniref:Uncharacterized protein n=1 Tax=Cucumis melo var. makuwa TaxID=1194695 RepID=A0A5A7VIY4_CUCMM|nr:hypothetical protein E6C27_scaffold90G001590 [Cucumis melo var. makuwa]